ncbi:hypothetical protein [Brevundimonas sp.]|uniref:hypothetical protein n=1 Tax=Brevundimonas sp. TaxID=1871086 RepID=UPI002D799D55|nr:hypothetical protein [Brevundimonas sp.]
MPRFQLQYLGPADATETIQAGTTDDAEDLARLRLLFSEPGFGIAIMSEGTEVRRVMQRPLASSLRF